MGRKYEWILPKSILSSSLVQIIFLSFLHFSSKYVCSSLILISVGIQHKFLKVRVDGGRGGDWGHSKVTFGASYNFIGKIW